METSSEQSVAAKLVSLCILSGSVPVQDEVAAAASASELPQAARVES